MPEVVLSIGANLGDRFAALQSVVDAMPAKFSNIRVSRVFETAPWGLEDQPSFLNAAVIAQTAMNPYEVLEFAQQCEAEAHRIRDIRWGPRTLDVDVIAYDALEQSDPVLTLPHPRAHERAFVLACIADLDPAWELHGATAQQLLAQIDQDGVVPVEQLLVTS